MLRSALFLVTALAASPAQADAQMIIDDGGFGEGGLVARNTGTDVLVVQSGQLNYREDCELAPMLLLDAKGEVYRGGYISIPFSGLGDEAELRSQWQPFIDEDAGKKVVVEPWTLRPGEAINLLTYTSDCGWGNSEVIAITIRTDNGDFVFDVQ